MIKENRIIDEIQGIRAAILDAKASDKGQAREALLDYVNKKHQIRGVSALKKSGLYKAFLTNPAMKHILEYLEL